MVNAISCKWWILNTQRSLNMVHRIGTFCHSRIWFHFVIAYLLDVLLKFHWLKKSLTKMGHSTAFPNSEEKKTAQEILKIWPQFGEFGKYYWHSLMNERLNEWIVDVTKRQVWIPTPHFLTMMKGEQLWTIVNSLDTAIIPRASCFPTLWWWQWWQLLWMCKGSRYISNLHFGGATIVVPPTW